MKQKKISEYIDMIFEKEPAVLGECGVCFDDLTSESAVMCPFCPEGDPSLCKECAREYILHSTSATPKCGGCKKDWTHKHLYELFGAEFVEGLKEGNYRHHIKKVYLAAEQSRFPETLGLIAQRAEVAARRDALIVDRDRYARPIYGMADELRLQLYYDLNRQVGELTNGKGMSTASVTSFVCPCPADGCKGMISTTTKECVICRLLVCAECREPLDKTVDIKDHKCDEDLVKTIKRLARDTKACPKCATLIHKVSGCDQMWCTQCTTAFSWTTGAIETGVIHNPHYYQYRNQNAAARGQQRPRNIGDVPCGGLVDIRHLQETGYTRDEKMFITTVHRRTGELQTKLRRHAPEPTEDYRIQFLRGDITEKVFKQKIFITNRENGRRLAKLQCYQTLQALLIERIRDVALEPHTTEHYNEFVCEVNNIREFVNNDLKSEVMYLGGTVAEGLSHTWKWKKFKTSMPAKKKRGKKGGRK